MSNLKLVIGLGNPGKQYEHTRHNAGFLAVEQFAHTSDWQAKPKFKSEIAELNEDGQKVILAKPQTMMNLSGEAVLALTQFYKLEPKDVLVVYDDFDLAFGCIRTRVGGSSGGHNGMESIIGALGDNFNRVRIGISSERKDQQGASAFVLDRFTQEESAVLPSIFRASEQFIREFLADTFVSDTRWCVE